MELFSSDKPSSKTGNINVIAEIKAKSGHEAEIRTILSRIVEPTRAEDGCKGYHLLESKQQPGTFYTYEEWTGENKLQKHLDGAKEMLEKMRSSMDGDMKLTVLEHLL